MPIKAALGNMPFAGNFADSLEMMKKIWGAAGLPSLPQFAQSLPQTLPSMMMPTLDIDELDKRIADLRAVEQWLALNAGMLRTTIQTLEVQRNTLATLKSFGAAMLAPLANAKAGQAANPFAESGSAASHASATGSAAAPPASHTATSHAGASPAPIPQSEGAAGTRADARDKAATKKTRRKRNTGSGVEPKVRNPFDSPLNPAAWWNTLQDQFTRIASSAVGTGEAGGAQSAAKASASGSPASGSLARGSSTREASARGASAKRPPRKRRAHKAAASHKSSSDD